MKSGTFVRIPESPDDLEELWCEAETLTAETQPIWLVLEDRSHYRFVKSLCQAELSDAGQRIFAEEISLLEERGFVLDPPLEEAEHHRLYLKKPQREPEWTIGIYGGASPLDLQAMDGVANPVMTRHHVTDVPASYVADPFILRRDETWHMFFEVWNWRTFKGEIAWAISTDGLRWDYQRVVLTEPFHLSYPYVFFWNDAFYLIPESHQAGAVRLYRATRFPTEWTFVGNLLEGPYLTDASVFRSDGVWWMFVDSSRNGEHDTLRLYQAAAELQGPWTEHPQSPLLQGAPHEARPAGRVVFWQGRWLRFAQNCRPAYGTDVRAFEIVELTATTYRERPATSQPILGGSGRGWNCDGMHHVDAQQLGTGRWLACVDGWKKNEED